MNTVVKINHLIKNNKLILVLKNIFIYYVKLIIK